MANNQMLPPVGPGLPWNLSPPNNGGVYVTPITPGYRYNPLPGDPGAGTGTATGGDTQVQVPNDTGTPFIPTFAFASGQPLTVRYIESGASVTSTSEGHNAPPIRVYLGANAAGPTVPGSLRFTFRGRTYVDRAGGLYYGIDPATNAGTLGGSYDYSTNIATITDYGAGSNTVTIVSMATRYVPFGVSGVMFRAPGSPLADGNFTLRATTMAGDEITATVDIGGVISGQMKGQVDWATGLVRVVFGEMVTAAGNESQPWYNADLIDGSGKIWRPLMVDPGSIYFGTVIVSSIPVDPSLIGVDAVRMPSDGRVLAFPPGWPVVVSHTAVTDVASPVAGSTTSLGRDRIGFIEIYDDAGVPIDDIWYTLDLDAGEVTWANPLNLSAYTLPAHIRHRIQDTALLADAQITGELTLATPVTHDYPAGTIVSAAVLADTLQARIALLFDQATYSAGSWSDVVVGSPAAASYNDVTYPIQVSNHAAITERWAIVFKSSSTVDVIGETVGQVLTGVSISDDIAPINPTTISVGDPTGKPYFTIKKEGWGGGWSTGNVVRFNSISSTKPLWLARVVTPGEIEHANDRVRLQAYGDAH